MSELIACPNCQRQLQIPENFFGQMVQCPDCQHQFQAAPATSGLQAKAPAPSASGPANPDRDETDRDDEPRRRRPVDDDDDDDFRVVRRRHHLTPHRATLVLVMGILAICCVAPVITGTIAWVLGNMDLKEMDAGRMDPEGRGQTQTGKTLGMIGVIINIIGIVGYCVFVMLFVVAAGRH